MGEVALASRAVAGDESGNARAVAEVLRRARVAMALAMMAWASMLLAGCLGNCQYVHSVCKTCLRSPYAAW